VKLPALWIVAAFAAGIGTASRWPASPGLWAAVAGGMIVAGGLFALRNRLAAAGIFALLAWFGTGALATGVERATVPANDVSRLIAIGRIDTSGPLRWRGRLREDPLRMPWGRRYEIALEEVEIAGAGVPVTGGLRANLYGGPQPAGAPDDLRAGDRVEALLRARPPRNFLDPGAFDLQGFLARQKINLVGSLRTGELLRLVDHPTPTLLHRLARARGNLLARLDALFAGQPERAAVLRAMLLGDRTFVESDVMTAFQKTSAYHVLVVAGLHVGALAVFFFWLGRRLRLSMAVVSLITLLALAAYVGIVQNRPPILRAALMVGLYLCARPLFRRVELMNTIALAGFAILFWKPSSLVDSSFQLSFLAAGAIAGLALPWMDRTSAPYRAGLALLGDVTRDIAHAPKIIQFRIEMRLAAQWLASRLPYLSATRMQALLAAPVRAGLRLWEIALLSAVIQWGMMPLMAQDFHRISLAGPLSNIPAVILTGFIVPLGFLTLVVTFLWARLAWVLAKALSLCAGMLLAIVEAFSRWPRVSYRIPGPPLWLVIAFFAALVILVATARTAAARRMNRIARRGLPPPIHPAEWMSALALMALTILIATHPFATNLVRGKLEVSVLDVGQGDSIFVAFPDGRTMLIDGGGRAEIERSGGVRTGMDIGEDVVSPYLWSRGLKRLDAVVLTHAHHDHLDGLHSVLQNFAVSELWIGRDEASSALAGLLAEAISRGVKIIHETRGEKFDWDGIKGEALWPADASSAPAAANDDSIVLRLTDGQVRFLLPGDIEKRVESTLAESHAPLAADFLKVPHHGSKTSSTEPFVAAVAPRVAVVSVGEANSFGHPAVPVIERYEQAGVRLLRTDRDGAVTALTDGRSLEVRTFLATHRK
jgi:competence protein ComEC